MAAIDAEDAALATRLEELEARWEQEKALVAQLHEKLDALDALAEDAPERADAAVAINATRAELARVQGRVPMINAVVAGNAVAQIIAAWTGIPVGKMVSDEIQTVLGLRDLLKVRVIGQGHALDAIAQRVRTSRANLADPGKPKGVFLLVGTSGVVTTETAIALADVLYGGERNMITIHMRQYQEAPTVSSLKASPPGSHVLGAAGGLPQAVRGPASS